VYLRSSSLFASIHPAQTKNIVINVQLYSSSILFLDDCGDHVVVINSKDIALPGDEWRQRVYFHHTGYPGGATWTLAWELHDKDPTMVRDLNNIHNLICT